MHAPKETERQRKAVLLFVDEQFAGTEFADSLVRSLLRHLRATVFGALNGAVAAVSYALAAPKWYRAQTVIVPVVQESSASVLGSLNSQLGGVVTLAGLDLDEGEDFKTQVVARRSSRDFVYDFLVDAGLMPVMFADKWVVEENNWRTSDRVDQPTVEQAYRDFVQNVFTVAEDRV